MRIVRGALIGAMAGLAGAYAMERFQSWWKEAEKELRPRETAHAAQDEPSTVKTAERISESVLARPLPSDAKAGAGRAVHYAMGVVSGVIYGAVAEVLPIVTTGAGLPFGIALWWIADNSIVPALRLSKPLETYPSSVHAYALSSHLVYGGATEMTRRMLRATQLLGLTA
jgi:putative membrane protein